jgi:hypothetical protein
VTAEAALHARLAPLVNDDPVLRRWGRGLDLDLLIEIGEERHPMSVRDGVVAPEPPAAWAFAMRFDADAWAAFMQPVPPPRRHDLIALFRTGALTLEGELHPFMSHLFWFKRACDALRTAEAEA